MTIQFEHTSNSNWGVITLPYGEKKKYHFPCYIPTREIFNIDPDPLIRCKCVVLTSFTLVVTPARSIYWLTKSIFLTISEFYFYLNEGQAFSQAAKDAILESAYDSFRALGYGVLLTGCSLTGILAPYWARLNYGHLERTLNRHTDTPHRDKLYVAICFQNIAILSPDYKDNDLRVTLKLTRYVSFIESMQKALLACDFRRILKEVR